MDENEALKHVSNELDKMSSTLNNALTELEQIHESLVQVNNLTGATARFEQMKLEIKNMGWDFVASKYHPDINVHDSAAHELFAMYKFAYDTMKRKNEI